MPNTSLHLAAELPATEHSKFETREISPTDIDTIEDELPPLPRRSQESLPQPSMLSLPLPMRLRPRLPPQPPGSVHTLLF